MPSYRCLAKQEKSELYGGTDADREGHRARTDRSTERNTAEQDRDFQQRAACAHGPSGALHERDHQTVARTRPEVGAEVEGRPSRDRSDAPDGASQPEGDARVPQSVEGGRRKQHVYDRPDDDDVQDRPDSRANADRQA